MKQLPPPTSPSQQKWAIMGGFVFLNTALLVTLRACSIHSSHSTEYLASTVVVFTELMKLAISLTCVYVFDAQQSWPKFQDVMIRAFLDDGLDILKLCLPAILYAIQNNLQYIIETAPLFQVLYQTKIVTTAIFFTFMLVKRISIKEWLAIIMLSIGVAMVESSQHDILPHHASDIVGMMSVIVACITSGFAGVYYEKVLKASRSSVWVINIELSMMSFSFSTIFAMIENPQEIIDYGIFKGFNVYVFLIVVFQAINGLGVALVVKYSDNIHKGFLASVAIVLGILIDSIIFQDAEINEKFGLGSFMVLVSSFAYFQLTTDHGVVATGGINGAVLSSGSAIVHSNNNANNSSSNNNGIIGNFSGGSTNSSLGNSHSHSEVHTDMDDDPRHRANELSLFSYRKWRVTLQTLANNLRQSVATQTSSGNPVINDMAGHSNHHSSTDHISPSPSLTSLPALSVPTKPLVYHHTNSTPTNHSHHHTHHGMKKPVYSYLNHSNHARSDDNHHVVLTDSGEKRKSLDV